MCTLIALLDVVAGYPIVVAMNRDEFYDRPAVPPELRTGSPNVVAPRDARAQGTWIGVNEHGLLAAVSNRFVGPPNPRARSRGLLCLESLVHRTAADAMVFAASATEVHTYNPFNLLHGDLGRLVCTSREETTWARHGEPGLNVLTNAGLNPDEPRARRVRELLQGTTFSDLPASIRLLRNTLADHTDVAGRAICHHGEKTGTVSQTLVAVSGEEWAHNRLWYSEGFPCESEPTDFSPLFGRKEAAGGTRNRFPKP